MKIRIICILLLIVSMCLGVKIGTDGENIYFRGEKAGVGVDTLTDPEAIFEIFAEDDGILIPRLSIIQRDAISSAPNGLLIYNTDCDLFNYYNGENWLPFPNLTSMDVGPIIGTTSVCDGASGVIYKIMPVPDAISYEWSVPDDAAIATGSGTDSITVNFGTESGRICVIANTICGSQGDCIVIETMTAPVGGSVTGGGTIDLGNPTPTLTLSGHSGTVSRWQRRLDAGSWIDISFTGTSFTETPSAIGTWDYRAVITSAGCPEAFSNYTTVIVEATVMGDSTVFTYIGSIESWTVPSGITSIEIEAWGAQGGTSTTENPSGFVGGKGARMEGTFSVTPGEQFLILVGQMGESAVWNGGGGGASWIVKVDPSAPDIMTGGGYSGTHILPMLIAGGGGGIRGQALHNGHDGVTSNYGTTGSGSSSSGGGVLKTTDLGLGGIWGTSSWGSGGGGLRGDGQADDGEGGHSFLSGGAQALGGTGHTAYGGVGGGGGNGNAGGGGGGGYSGGDGGFVAGGGGSWNSGTDQDNSPGIREGNGRVVIRR